MITPNSSTSKNDTMLSRRRFFKKSRKCIYVLPTIIFGIFWLLYFQFIDKDNEVIVTSNVEFTENADLRSLYQHFNYSNSSGIFERSYLVNSTKCKIPNIDPFDAETLPYYDPQPYIPCWDRPLLTYVTKYNNKAILHIDKRLVSKYTDDVLFCCYSYISRGETDMDLNREMCVEFTDRFHLTKPTVLIECVNGNAEEIYKNVHTVVLSNPELEKKLAVYKLDRPLSILFIGIDSISRSNLLRSLPNTHTFLEENNFINFKGYNKIADNTFPNLIAILTGTNQTRVFETCDPKVIGGIEKCNLIWKSYRDLGFITAYAEDEAEMNTFNLLKKGFKNEPTDFYYRSYIYATEKYLKFTEIDSMRYCTGPENAGARIFNIAKDFAFTFKNHSSFGFFWTNSFSHNGLNSPSRMDTKIVEFLGDLKRNNVFEDSIVLFISDHGLRFGKFLYTYSGWLEERLPAFYLSLPTWFKNKYSQEYQNLLKNSNKLTTPYDLYMTFQDILKMSGRNYTKSKSEGCPKCKSLFEEIEEERSCEDAAIPWHYCTCHAYFTIPTNQPLVEEAAKFILDQVHKTILKTSGDFDLCYRYKIAKIISAGFSKFKSSSLEDGGFFLLKFETYPEAVFQGTVSLRVNELFPKFQIEGSVSRLDYYKEKSWCVFNADLAKYCYCQKTLQVFYSIVNSVKRKVFSFF